MEMKPRILIIDDNRRYTSMLRDYFEAAGGTVEHVLSSEAGREYLRKNNPGDLDIIVTDITMETQISGILLVRRMRRLGFRGCLLIYSTGFNFTSVLHLSRLFFGLMGADGLLSKASLAGGKPELWAISRCPMLEWARGALQRTV